MDLGTTAPRLTSESVRYWSDYNRVFYHPKSIVQLNEYELNSQTMPFEDWNVGEELFNDLDKEHDLLDRDVRPFLEECDHLRALQLFAGSDDAWGGFAASYMERLRDEFGKKSIWVWAIEDGTRTQRVSGTAALQYPNRRLAKFRTLQHHQFKRDTNKARSLCSISQQASLYVPIIDLPNKLPGYLEVDRQSEWQKTALIASAIETVTLPSRLKPFQYFEAALAGEDGTHTIFELQSSINKINDGHTTTSSNEDEPAKVETEFDIDFTYDGEEKGHIFNQVQVSRGDEPERASESAQDQDVGKMRKLRLNNSESMLQR